VSQKAGPSKQPPKEAKPSPNLVTLLKPNIELDVFFPLRPVSPDEEFCSPKKSSRAASTQDCQMANFSNQKSPFGCILEYLGIENVGIFLGHLENLTTVWHVSWPFGIFCGHFGTFPPFWYVAPRQIWQPWSTSSGESCFV
jgi:hypothetical protein